MNETELKKLYDLSIFYVDHEESRVRQSSGDLLSSVVKVMKNDDLFEAAYSKLILLIKRDLARDPSLADLPENEKVRQKIMEGQLARGQTSKDIFHESAGWRHLETSMTALRRLFESNQEKFQLFSFSKLYLSIIFFVFK